MKKLTKIEMKQVRGGDSLGNTCTTKTICVYITGGGAPREAVCQSRLVGGSWECRCGNSSTPCSDQ